MVGQHLEEDWFPVVLLLDAAAVEVPATTVEGSQDIGLQVDASVSCEALLGSSRSLTGA